MPAIVPQVRTSNQHCRIIDIKWYQIQLPLINGAHYILYKSIITRWSSCSNADAFNLPCCCHIQRVRLRTADHRLQVEIGMCVCDCFCVCVRMLLHHIASYCIILHHIASYWRYSSKSLILWPLFSQIQNPGALVGTTQKCSPPGSESCCEVGEDREGGCRPFVRDVRVTCFTLWLCQNSYWKWPFIVSFPIKNGDFP